MVDILVEGLSYMQQTHKKSKQSTQIPLFLGTRLKGQSGSSTKRQNQHRPDTAHGLHPVVKLTTTLLACPLLTFHSSQPAGTASLAAQVTLCSSPVSTLLLDTAMSPGLQCDPTHSAQHTHSSSLGIRAGSLLLALGSDGTLLLPTTDT